MLCSRARSHLYQRDRVFDRQSDSGNGPGNRANGSRGVVRSSVLEATFEVARARVCSVEFDARSDNVPVYRSDSGTFVVGCSFINLPTHIHSPILTTASKHPLVGTLSPASAYVTGGDLAGVWHQPAALVLYASTPCFLLRGFHGLSRPTG